MNSFFLASVPMFNGFMAEQKKTDYYKYKVVFAKQASTHLLFILSITTFCSLFIPCHPYIIVHLTFRTCGVKHPHHMCRVSAQQQMMVNIHTHCMK